MRYGTQTDLTPNEVLARARSYFGPGGKLGLPEVPGQPEGVTFAAPSGGVSVSAHTTDGRTEVIVLSREYDYWAERFIRDLH
jgi:hypothetical protein